MNTFSVVHNMDVSTPAKQTSALKLFNQWVQRFVPVGAGRSPLVDGEDNEPLIAEIKKVGHQVAVRGKAPVFGKFKGFRYPALQLGGVHEFAQNEVKIADFIRASWVNHSGSDLKEGMVDKQFFVDTAKTLNLIRRLMRSNQMEILSLHVPEEFLPGDEGEAYLPYRDAFLQVIERWSREQRVNVMLHSLKVRTLADDQKDVMESDEVKIVKAFANPYLIPMPHDNAGTDLIATALSYLEHSPSSIPANVPATGNKPVLVTLIAGDSWKPIGGNVHSTDTKKKITVEQRMALTMPLMPYLFNFASNKLIWAKMAYKLFYGANARQG